MSHHDVSDRYLVEVSGWDAEEQFFVEQTELAWDERSEKKLRLQRPPKPGAAVFLRLLSADPRSSMPVAYLASEVRRNVQGGYDIILKPIRPARPWLEVKSALPAESEA